MAGTDEECVVAWEKFFKTFKGKFYPRSFCDKKWKELLNLVDLTITEYEKQFTELGKYCFVTYEADKCKRFEEGLWIEIRAPVKTNMHWFDFSTLVELPWELMDARQMIKKKKKRFVREGPYN